MIISRDYIRELAGKEEFNAGCHLYRYDRVKEYSYSKSEYVDFIGGNVKDNGHDTYKTSIEVSRDSGDIISCVCDCGRASEWDGLCRHCVAVLLEYRDQMNNFAAIGEYLKKINNHGGAERGKYGERIKPLTTPGLKEILYRSVSDRTFMLNETDIYGKVRLQPALKMGRNDIHVSFKVGTKQMYVIKDVFDFVALFERGEKYRYGKQLEFVHIDSALDEKSGKILEFISNWVKNNKNRYRISYNNNHYYGIQQNSSYDMYQKLKEIPLSPADFDEFMEIMRDDEIMAEVQDRHQWGTVSKWQMSDETFKYHVHIRGDNNDGVSINISNVYTCAGIKNLYVFENGEIHVIPKESFGDIQEFVLRILGADRSNGYIGADDVSLFVRDFLPGLQEKCECEISEFVPEKYSIAKPDYEIYIDMPQYDMISIKPFAVYGTNKYALYDTETDIALRDIKDENGHGRVIAKYTNAFERENMSMVISDEELMYDFLTEGIKELQESGQVFISDELKKIEISGPPRMDVGVSLSGDMLELNITTDGLSIDEVAEILSKYNRKKKYYRLKNGNIIRLGSEFDTLADITSDLQLKAKQLADGSVQIPKFRALYIDEQLREGGKIHTHKNKDFKSLIRNMKTIGDNDFEVPSQLENIMREYQKYGFMWIKTLYNNGFGGILADDMGLGKTLQVIAFLLSEKLENADEKISLIVCPASLVYNWKNEIEKFAPELNAKIITGNANDRRELIADRAGYDVMITSYDLLKRDIDEYENIDFFCQVIDEAQYIKNHTTQVSRAVKEICAGFKLALTGTPVENRLSELHSIFEYLMPGFLYSYKRFRNEIEVPVVQENDKNVMKRLQKIIGPFVLRRLKKDVLKELPDKLEKCMYIQMDYEQQRLYDAHAKRLKMQLENSTDSEFISGKLQVLSELTKLRQICCNPLLVYDDYKGGAAKLEVCLDMINEAVENGHKILLFSQFTTMFAYIQEGLDKRGIKYYTLTGTTKKEKRIELVERFNTDDVPVFCISLKAGGTGLNLTAADIVIHYDPWWNIAVENQATDRAHRIGQKNVVNVYKLITKGTIEENIIRLQDKKRELADNILGGESGMSGNFSREELIEILK